jgi:hypothetical protein
VVGEIDAPEQLLLVEHAVERARAPTSHRAPPQRSVRAPAASLPWCGCEVGIVVPPQPVRPAPAGGTRASFSSVPC